MGGQWSKENGILLQAYSPLASERVTQTLEIPLVRPLYNKLYVSMLKLRHTDQSRGGRVGNNSCTSLPLMACSTRCTSLSPWLVIYLESVSDVFTIAERCASQKRDCIQDRGEY